VSEPGLRPVPALGARRGWRRGGTWKRGRLGALALAALALITGAGAGPATAHTRSQSYSRWTIDGRDARVVLRVALLELTRLPGADVGTGGLEAWLGGYAPARLVLHAGGERCRVAGRPSVVRPDADRVGVAWRVACPPVGALAIESALLREVAPGHLHFTRVARAGGASAERVLSARAPRWELDAGAGEGGGPGGLAGWIGLGAAHILGGADHLLFLGVLLLGARSIRELALVASGFTAGHSVTLALAALQLVRPEGAAVEALIGLSIALVAAENLAVAAGRVRAVGGLAAACLLALAAGAAAGWGAVPAVSLAGLALFAVCQAGLVGRAGRAAGPRALVAALFGLVHGLGFGGVLVEAGLEPDRVARALLGFNAGVELGQLAVVAVAWPLAARVVRRRPLAGEVASGGVLALGVYWFVVRAWG